MDDAGRRSDLEARLDEAARARERILSGRSTGDIVAALAAAAGALADPGNEHAGALRARLDGRIALGPAMIAESLRRIFGALDRESLLAWVAAEAGSPEALEPGATDRRCGPALLYHGLAGNVPGQSVPAIAAALLARSAVVVRDSARQPSLTDAFVRRIDAHDSDLAAMVVPVELPGDDATLVGIVRERCTAVQLHGSDETLSAAGASFAGKPTVLHGSRISWAVALEGEDPETWSDRLADDVAMYEGLGCLTPRTLLVVGGDDQALRWQAAVGAALDRFQRRMPRHAQRRPLEITRRQYLDRAEIDAATGAAQLATGAEHCWAIAVRNSPGAAAPGMRCLDVRAVRDAKAAAAFIAAAGTPPAGIAIAGPIDDRLEHAFTAASRVCPAGHLQSPPVQWQQDGLRRLGDLLGPPGT